MVLPTEASALPQHCISSGRVFQESDKSLLLGLEEVPPFLQQWEIGWRRDLTLVAVCVW